MGEVLDFLAVWYLLVKAGDYEIRGIPIYGWLGLVYERVVYGFPIKPDPVSQESNDG